MKYLTEAVETFATMLEMNRDSGTTEFFSHMSCRLHLAARSAVYRAMSSRGLIVKSKFNDRHQDTTVWDLTEKALRFQPCEAMSAFL